MNNQTINTNSSSNPTKSSVQFGGALKYLTYVGGFGALVVIIYSTQSQRLEIFISLVGSGLLVAGASFLVGGLMGFLFGIPRTLQQEGTFSGNMKAEEGLEENVAEKVWYRPNTNLEDISDWLTKILVGVGLTQLVTLPEKLEGVGRVLAPAFGGETLASSQVFAIGVFIYFVICGFLIGFLWTRLALPRLQVEADLAAAELKGLEKGVEIGVEKGVEIGADQKEKQFLESVDKASALHDLSEPYILWVDDRPGNNERERALMERVLGLKFTNVRSTEEALAEIENNPKKYKIVISDMGRPGDSQAGYTLLEKLKQKGFQLPYIIYASSGRPEHDAEARRRGALGSTNSPQRLLDLVSSAFKES